MSQNGFYRGKKIGKLRLLVWGESDKVLQSCTQTERCTVIIHRECPLFSKRKVAPKELSTNV